MKTNQVIPHPAELNQVNEALDSATCGELLYGEGEFKAKCIHAYGVEHCHNDLTAEQAVEQGLAEVI